MISTLFLFNAFHLSQPLALCPPALSQLIEKSLERPSTVKAHLVSSRWVFWERIDMPNSLYITGASLMPTLSCSQLRLVPGDISELEGICSAHQTFMETHYVPGIEIECPSAHPKTSCPYFHVHLQQVDLACFTKKVKFVRSDPFCQFLP